MRKDIDMLHGPLGPAIVRFTIPVILTTLLQTLFSTVDLIVVGQFCGSLEVAAVTAPGALIALLVNLFTGLSLGAGLTVAKAIGSHREEDITKAVHTAIPTAIIGGIFLSIVGAIYAPKLLELMNPPADVLPLSAVYIRIYFAGIVFTVVYNFCAAILRATGDTKSPLLFLLIAGALKIVLTILATLCGLNVAGVALATVVSQSVAATLVMLALIRRTDSCKLFLKKMRFYKAPLLSIIKIGLPAGLQTSLLSLANVTTSIGLNSFDSADILAGNGACTNLELFTDAIGIGFTQATPNFIAQNLGAKQYDRVKKTFVLCMAYGGLLVLAACLLMYPFGRPLLGLYLTDSPAAIEFGLLRMKYILLTGFLIATMTVSTGALQGLGHSVPPTAITLMTNGVMRVIWIYTIFSIPEYHTLDCLYIIYPISWLLTTVLEAPLFYYYLKKKIRADHSI